MLSHTPHDLAEAHLPNDGAELVSIPVPGEAAAVRGYVHAPSRPTGAGAVLVSGVGGGVAGPTGMWVSLASRLARAGVAAVRLDYRAPGHTPRCVEDMRTAADMLRARFGAHGLALVGWSFGSAPVLTLAAQLGSAVRAVAVVAPQTHDALEPIRRVPPMPVLLVHGTHDRCLSSQCSVHLKRAYDAAAGAAHTRCDVMLLEGDDHCLTHRYAEAETRILDHLLGALLSPAPKPRDHATSMVPSEDMGIDLMRKGHDLDAAPTGEHESINQPTRTSGAA